MNSLGILYSEGTCGCLNSTQRNLWIVYPKEFVVFSGAALRMRNG